MDNKEVKKHISAIRTSNEVGLLARKIWNVLLLNAYDELLTSNEHSIPISVLSDVIGYNSKSYTSLIRAFEKLQATLVKWDIGGGAEVKGAWLRNVRSSQMMGSYEINNGVLRYWYAHGLPELLYNPAIYQKIDISQQRLFKTSGGIALWENCLRYINTGSTGFSDIEEWRELLGASSKKYQEYYRFNERVLKKSIAEVNNVSNIEITLKIKKKGRKVIEIGFDIKAKKLKELLSGSRLTSLESTPEYSTLLTHGIHKVKALKWLDDYGNSYIREKLDFVEQQAETGNVKKSLSGLLVKAIENDYQSEEMVQKRLEQDRKNKTEQARQQLEQRKKQKAQIEKLEKEFRIREIDKYLSLLSEKEAEALLDQAKKENPLLSGSMKSLSSSMCLAFLLPKIPNYKKNKAAYIKRNRQ